MSCHDLQYFRAAEAARIQAEDKLMEIAIAKLGKACTLTINDTLLEVDEVVNKVDQVLKKIIDQSDKFTVHQVIFYFNTISNYSLAQRDVN